VTTSKNWLMHAYIHHRVLLLFWYMSIEKKKEKKRLIAIPIKNMILFLPDPPNMSSFRYRSLILLSCCLLHTGCIFSRISSISFFFFLSFFFFSFLSWFQCCVNKHISCRVVLVETTIRWTVMKVGRAIGWQQQKDEILYT
jgi:hypothetical protein